MQAFPAAPRNLKRLLGGLHVPRALATLAPQRSTLLPGVPTAKETGYPELEAVLWYGMLAPAGTPPAIVERLGDAMRQSLAKPDTRQLVAKLGGISIGDRPAEFRAFLEKDMERWARVIKASGLKADVSQ